jgi:hypothetical protein
MKDEGGRMNETIALLLEEDAISDRRVMYEDELPADMTAQEYSAWFAKSFVDGVRMGPVFERHDLPDYQLQDTPRCALPDVRFVLAAGVVAVGALMSFANLLRIGRR